MTGEVYVDGQRVLKAGTRFPDHAQVEVRPSAPPYVSRGGLKLQHALEAFAIDPAGLMCMDVGASTGGFTDCLLQHGARQVIAVDVGYGQLDWKLRQDPRVVVHERMNFRHVSPGQLPSVHLIVVDVSFISLTKIVPVADHFLLPGGQIVCLVKPQFEIGKGQVGKKGIVRHEADHRRVLTSFGSWCYDHGWQWRDVTFSPIQGAEGNIEFFLCLARLGDESIHFADTEWPGEVERVVALAHRMTS